MIIAKTELASKTNKNYGPGLVNLWIKIVTGTKKNVLESS
jgi:hypothetical protein